jgi:hypothetical protein
MRFTLARDGRVVRVFDPLLYDHPSVGDPLIEEANLPFGQPHAALQAAANLFEQVSGIQPTRHWLLTAKHPTGSSSRLRPFPESNLPGGRGCNSPRPPGNLSPAR